MKGVTIKKSSVTTNTCRQVTGLTGQKSEFLGIQALRCCAALLVVITHATYMWADHTQASSGSTPWDNGTVGVDIFFVISGFVMMTSSKNLYDQPHPARVFLWRRFVRIAPLYWLLTSIKLLLIETRPYLALHPLPSRWNIVASYLFLPSYGATGEIRPVLPIGWTLNFEMFFYVLFAIALALRISVLYILLPVMGLLSVGAFFRTPDSPALTAFADPIVLDFVAGVVIAMSLRPLRSIPIRLAGVVGAFGALEIILFVPHVSISLIRILTYGGASVAIVGTTIVYEPYLAKMLPRWVLLLGEASYSIYLIQSFALPAAAGILSYFGLFQLVIPSGAVECVCILAGLATSVLLALPVYQFIERPLTRHLKRINLAGI